MTARWEILEAARRLRGRGLEPFAPADILRELRATGSTYPESTLRTYIVSVMCIDAPSNHAVRYPDLERVGRGQYRLADTAGDAPEGLDAATARNNDRAESRDVDVQERILRAISRHGGTSRWPLIDVELPASRETRWQLDDLHRRAYVRITEDSDGTTVELTRAGQRAATDGLSPGPATRRAPLEPHELEVLHQLLWDAADAEPGDPRRRYRTGIKWLLEEHFLVETRDGAGPQGRARRDAFRRLEEIGAIEQIGGGRANRTGTCWVINPGMVQYPW